jgi:hypothetical protein
LGCLALAALAGCGRPGPPAVPDSDYYPLQVGTTWIYRGADKPLTIRVARHEVVDGTPCAVVETLRGKEVATTQHVFAKSDGVYALKNNDTRLSKPLPLLKLPPSPGLTWQVRFQIGGHDRLATYRIGKTEEIEVPLGKFEAIPLQSQIVEGGVRQMALTHWFAREIGMVKQVVQTEGQTRTYELEKFERPK